MIKGGGSVSVADLYKNELATACENLRKKNAFRTKDLFWVEFVC